jgi:hypothetical protein
MISEETKLLIDLTLGDGYIGFPPNCVNARFTIAHCEKQRDYALHKYVLLDAQGFNPKEHSYISNHSNKVVQIRTSCDVRITTAHKWLYNKKIKTIDKALLRQLDDKSLAYWFMDDGNVHSIEKLKFEDVVYTYEVRKAKSYQLNVQAFTIDQAKLIKDWLSSFGVESTILASKGPRINIGKRESKDKFVSIIKPHIVPCMLYKIQYTHTFSGVNYTVSKVQQ